MKVGLITNLQQIRKFQQQELAFADSNRWMSATGGNTGNVAFVEGIQNILRNQIAGEVHWGDDPASVKKYYDHLVVCCANQIGAHVELDNWVARLQAFDLPTTFIGLGAQSDKIGVMPQVPEGTVKFLALSKSLRANANSPNIITRGTFSSEVLAQYGVDSNPYGCPSQFISTELNVGRQCLAHQNSAITTRILTAAGNPWHRSSTLEPLLVEIAGKYNGDFVVQHPQLLMQLALGETNQLTESQQKTLQRVYAALGSLEKITSWFKSYGMLFADAQNWMQYSKKFTLAIGPRYHGVALPIQAGIPGKVIAIDSRTEELALTTGIPYMHFQEVVGLSAEQLIEQCRWNTADAINYDDVRKRNAEQYVSFLKANNLHVAQNLQKLADFCVNPIVQ